MIYAELYHKVGLAPVSKCVCGLSGVPSYSACAEGLAPAARCVTVFGDAAFKEVMKGRMKSFGWALIQYDWCPLKKRRLGHRDTEGRPCEDREKMAAYAPQREAC